MYDETFLHILPKYIVIYIFYHIHEQSFYFNPFKTYFLYTHKQFVLQCLVNYPYNVLCFSVLQPCVLYWPVHCVYVLLVDPEPVTEARTVHGLCLKSSNGLRFEYFSFVTNVRSCQMFC